MFSKKKLSCEDLRRIVSIYDNYNLPYLPKILDYSIKENDSWIIFEFIEGTHATSADSSNAFFTLGKMHYMCRNGLYKNGFNTVCHGDFHLRNIILQNEQIKFIDVVFLHLGWNFSDLDYVDFFDFFDPVKYPWMINDKNCLKSYCEGIEHKLSVEEEEELKKQITINNLQNYIKNGLKNRIDISAETKYLQSLLSSIKYRVHK